MPHDNEEDVATYNRLEKVDPEAAMEFIVEWMKTPEARRRRSGTIKKYFPKDWALMAPGRNPVEIYTVRKNSSSTDYSLPL